MDKNELFNLEWYEPEINALTDLPLAESGMWLVVVSEHYGKQPILVVAIPKTIYICNMHIKSVHIENYKSYKGCFDISLNDGINILVGNN